MSPDFDISRRAALVGIGALGLGAVFSLGYSAYESLKPLNEDLLLWDLVKRGVPPTIVAKAITERLVGYRYPFPHTIHFHVFKSKPAGVYSEVQFIFEGNQVLLDQTSVAQRVEGLSSAPDGIHANVFFDKDDINYEALLSVLPFYQFQDPNKDMKLSDVSRVRLMSALSMNFPNNSQNSLGIHRARFQWNSFSNPNMIEVLLSNNQQASNLADPFIDNPFALYIDFYSSDGSVPEVEPIFHIDPSVQRYNYISPLLREIIHDTGRQMSQFATQGLGITVDTVTESLFASIYKD
jgi:hypothetical protein